MAAGPEIAIEVRNLSKLFRIPHEKHATLKAAALNVFRKRSYTELHALEDINFEVRQGEFFGIIGKNGCGKSTLLKIIAGIYVPSGGDIDINGRISPFLELGVGFNPELTARENVFLGGAILGLSRRQIEEKFEEIVRFSELQEFIDMKFKNFSSGMQVRLAFSLAIHAHAEILLMDEVLAVGDTNFQNKCLTEFNKYKEEGKTIVLVTHDIGIIQRYCDRAMLLRDGRVSRLGKTDEVVNAYLHQNIDDVEQRLNEEQQLEPADAAADKEITITGVEFLNGDGESTNDFAAGEDIVTRIKYVARKPLPKPVFGVAVHTQEGTIISGTNTRIVNFDIPEISGEGHLDFIIRKAPFFSGIFNVTVSLYDWKLATAYAYQEQKYRFKVKSSEESQYGIVKLDAIWRQ